MMGGALGSGKELRREDGSYADSGNVYGNCGGWGVSECVWRGNAGKYFLSLIHARD